MTAMIKRLNNDEKIRQQCEARFFYEFDKASFRAEGREEGRKEGWEAGLEAGQTEVICRLHAKGFSLEEIADITEKDPAEIKALISKKEQTAI